VVRQTVTKNRDNLIVPGQGSLLISCHVDTVPPAGMKNAFKPRKIGKLIYGRGASDVKGPLASLLTALEEFAEEKDPHILPVTVAFVIDEETNSALGSKKVLEILDKNIKECLVLEPTYGTFCSSQLGTFEFTVRIKGGSGHASEFEKVENPLKVAMRLIDMLESKLHRPVNIIHLKGGSKVYSVPSRAEALLEFKLFKDESPQEIHRKVQHLIHSFNSDCTISLTLEDAEPFIDFCSEDLAEFFIGILRKATGISSTIGTMPSWTDGANYYRAGLKTVIFGFGDLLTSHTPREHIHEKDLLNMYKFFRYLLQYLT
jgi:acetylornithine deacetylase/succinyl-diaminopimelate desuccinylase-like protein